MLVPSANARGAAAGMLSAHLMTFIIICGSFAVIKSPTVALPTSVEGCSNETFSPWIDKLDYSQPMLQTFRNMQFGECTQSSLNCMEAVQPVNKRSIWQNIFGMSFMYYGLFGTLVTVFVGIVFSWMTKSYEKNEYDERLLHPIVRKYLNKKMEDANDANAEYLKVKNNPSVYIISNDCENNEIYGKNVDNETPPPKYRRTDSS